MTSHDTALPLGGGDLRVGLEALSSLAVRVLNEHTNHTGLCAVCGCPCPCQWEVLADHNVAAAL